MRPFHFGNLFWGEHYREFYFIDKYVHSMMSPSNWPMLDARDGHKLIIACPEPDWQALTSNKLMQTVSRHVTLKWVDMPYPDWTVDDTWRTKSIGHLHKYITKLLRETHDVNAIGSLWSPDHMASDGIVANMLKWADKYDLVIGLPLRQSEEPLLAEIGKRRMFGPRKAAGLYVRHLHQEMKPYIEPVHNKVTHAPYRIWEMPDNGLLIHGFFGLAIIMDYRKISPDYREGNIDTCLRTGNFAACERVKIVDDSDDGVILSLTPKDYKNYHPFPAEPWSRHNNLGNMRTAWQFFGEDHVRRQMFRTPMRFHELPITDAWREREAAIEREVQSTIDNNWLNWLRFDAEKTPLGQQAKWWATYAPKRAVQKILGA